MLRLKHGVLGPVCPLAFAQVLDIFTYRDRPPRPQTESLDFGLQDDSGVPILLVSGFPLF